MKTALQEAPAAERPYLRVVLRDPCSFCGEPSAVLDHLTPKRLGGTSGWENYVGACTSCNNRKGRTTLLGFLTSRLYEPERRVADELRVLLANIRRIGVARG